MTPLYTRIVLTPISVGLFFLSAMQASAQVTTTYTYDAQGRVILSDATNDDASSYLYDDAGNIERVQATSLGASALNQPPDCDPVVRVTTQSSYVISGIVSCTDPNGDTMSVVSATDPAGTPSVSVSGNTLTFQNLQVTDTAQSDVTVSDGNGGITVVSFGIYREQSGGGFPF